MKSIYYTRRGELIIFFITLYSIFHNSSSFAGQQSLSVRSAPVPGVYSSSMLWSPLGVDQVAAKHDEVQSTRSIYFKPNEKTFSLLRSAPAFIIKNIPLPGSDQIDISVSSFTIIGEDAQFIEHAKHVIIRHPPPDIRLYRGVGVNEENSFVYFAIEENAITGTIQYKGKEYSFSTMKDHSITNSTTIIQLTEVAPANQPTICGVTEADGFIVNSPSPALLKGAKISKTLVDTLLAKVAIDADYEAFQHYGGVAQTENYIIARMGEVSAIYQRDIAIKLEISFLRVWSAANDPYTASNMSGVLSEFTNHWKANMDTVRRALAVLVSQRALDGFDSSYTAGLASLDALCNKNRGYAFDRFSASNNFISGNTGILAHEIGHVFGSRHTQSCWWNPPIDSCAGPEDGSCFTGNKQVNGEIMSYCNGKTNEFRNRVAPYIRSRAQAAACLSIFSQIRNITLTSFVGGESVCAGSSQQINWTSAGVTNVKIELSANGGSIFTTLVASLSAPTGTWTWNISSAQAAGNQYRIRIVDADVGSPIAVSTSNFEIKAVTIITDQPIGKIVCVGANVTLNVTATGAGTISYQWKKDGVDIQGQTTSTLQLNQVTKQDSAVYTVVITGACGSVTSQNTLVTVNKAPEITKQPEDITACLGKAASLGLQATGDNPTFKWYKDVSTLLPNANGPTLSFASVTINDQGSYFCQITSTCGPVMSNTVYLTVSAPAISLLAPSGGEKLAMGDFLSVHWTSTCVQKVKIEYSTNGGQTWSTAITDYDAIMSQFRYKLPNTPTDKARIRISDASNGSVIKESQNFSVGASPILQASKTQIDFGNVPIGEIRSQVLTLNNTGIAQLDVTKTELSGSAMFVLNNGGLFSLLPNASRDLTIQFQPTFQGQQSGSLRIEHNAAGSPTNIPILGNAILSSVDEQKMIPKMFVLGQNYPNPFTTNTTIEVRHENIDSGMNDAAEVQVNSQIESAIVGLKSQMTLKVFDLFGRQVLDLTNQVQDNATIVVHRSQLPASGIYFYRLTVSGYSETQKMVVME